MRYIERVKEIIEPGETVEIVGPAGFAYKGTILTISDSVVRIKTQATRLGDEPRDISINPAHIVSISVTWVEL